MRLASLSSLGSLCRLDPSHHLLLGDQVINPLQMTQQALHVRTPLIQYIISISWLRKVDNPSRTINLSVHRLRSNQLADVFLGLIFGKIEQLGQARHLDTGIVLCDDPDIVLDHALAKILPALVSLLVGGLVRCGVEDIGAAEVRAEKLGDFGPAHEFVDGEELEKLSFERDLAVAGVTEDAVEEVRLFVVVGSEDYVVDDSLQNLDC